MNIKQILLNKFPNASEAHIDDYLQFCFNQDVRDDNGRFNEHHILPRHDFKEYVSFLKYPLNKSVLTTKRHVIAHYKYALIADTYKAWHTVALMMNTTVNGVKYLNEEEFSELLWIFNDLNGRRIMSDDHKEKIRISNLETWSKPDVLQRASEIQLEVQNRASVKTNKSASLKKTYATPEGKAAKIAQQNKSGVSEKKRKGMLEKYKDQTWKATRDANVKKAQRTAEYWKLPLKRDLYDLWVHLSFQKEYETTGKLKYASFGKKVAELGYGSFNLRSLACEFVKEGFINP